MSARLKYGFIIGVVGLGLTICAGSASAYLGMLCGPIVSIFAGAVAGLLTGREEITASAGGSAQGGAISGAIAGGFTLVGLTLGGIVSLVIFPTLGIQPPIGDMSSINSTAEQMGYWTGQVGVVFCCGVLGLMFSAGAGAAVAYFMYRPQPPAVPQM